MILIQPGSLILLSGAPGSGKSTLARTLPVPNSAIISSDDLRRSFFGTEPTLIEGESLQAPRTTDDRLVFQTIEAVVTARMKAGLTTVVDATLIDEGRRSPLTKIAATYNRPVLALILDVPLETLKERNTTRENPVPLAVLESFHNRLERKSASPYLLCSGSERFSLQHTLIPENVDVVGDVHGCIEPLLALLQRWGYQDLEHPAGRTLLFLGDLIDRGPDSLAVLDLAMQAQEKGHVVLLGNHEYNLRTGLQGGEVRSPTTRETLHQVNTRAGDYSKRVLKFLLSLPSYAISWDGLTGYCHADVPYFNPTDQPLRYLVKGTSKIGEGRDTDGEFAANLGHSAVQQLVRGHIPATSKQTCVTSLDRGVGYGGPLCGLRDGVVWEEACDYNYNDRLPTVQKQLETLVKQKLVTCSTVDSLSIYTYSRKAYFAPRSVWDQNPLLYSTRSLVLGLDGEPVNRPFTRLKNYGEPGTQIDGHTELVAAEKVNGFLGQVFLHPYEKGKLVTTTSRSLQPDNSHMQMFRSFLYKDGMYSRVQRYLSTQEPTTTLMFEVVHPEDRHIISYTPEEQGLYIIGIGRPDGYALEQERDDVAGELGFHRLTFFQGLFDDILTLNSTCRHEGYMLRDLNGKYVVKLKSPWYLTQKLVARLQEERVETMFANPKVFKHNHLAALEELHILVDAITTQFKQDEWQTMTEGERLDFTTAVLKNHSS